MRTTAVFGTTLLNLLLIVVLAWANAAYAEKGLVATVILSKDKISNTLRNIALTTVQASTKAANSKSTEKEALKAFATTAAETMWKDIRKIQLNSKDFTVAAAACHNGGTQISFSADFVEMNITVIHPDGDYRSRGVAASYDCFYVDRGGIVTLYDEINDQTWAAASDKGCTFTKKSPSPSLETGSYHC